MYRKTIDFYFLFFFFTIIKVLLWIKLVYQPQTLSTVHGVNLEQIN
jgi:hypothetical protein